MQGYNEQFITWYDEYSQSLFKFCFFRISSKEEAEDIVAKAFVKTWEYIQQGNEIEYPKTFLYKTANNLIIDFYRTNKRNRELSLDAQETSIEIPIDADFVDQLDTRSLVLNVHTYIAKLPEKYQTVVLLKYVEDLTVGEIAEITGLSENNISVRLHRAIDKLKKQIHIENKNK